MNHSQLIPRRVFKRGIYESSYGKAVFVAGPSAKTAWDLDMEEKIPISEVTTKFLRPAEISDLPVNRAGW